jgi:hypothetical protein
MTVVSHQVSCPYLMELPEPKLPIMAQEALAL